MTDNGALAVIQPGGSVRDDEGLANQLYFVDRLPDDPFAEVDESTMITSGSEFRYSARTTIGGTSPR